jgi:hypothetical protein
VVCFFGGEPAGTAAQQQLLCLQPQYRGWYKEARLRRRLTGPAAGRAASPPPLRPALLFVYFCIGYGSGATNFVSGCGRGYVNKKGLKQHLHGQQPNWKRCADAQCIRQAIEYPVVRNPRNPRV